MTHQPAAPPIIVSDHALIRYMERVMRLDIEAVRRKIERAVKPIAGGRGRRNLKAGGFTYVLQNNHVTTVLDNGMRATNRVDHPAAPAFANGQHKDAT